MSVMNIVYMNEISVEDYNALRISVGWREVNQEHFQMCLLYEIYSCLIVRYHNVLKPCYIGLSSYLDDLYLRVGIEWKRLILIGILLSRVDFLLIFYRPTGGGYTPGRGWGGWWCKLPQGCKAFSNKIYRHIRHDRNLGMVLQC